MRLARFCKKIVLPVIGLVSVMACKDPFEPNIRGNQTGFLVVEGYINIGTNAITVLRLSRTTPVSTSINQIPETGAAVFIEDEELNRYPLTEKSTGIYESSPLTLTPSVKFRISITTSSDAQYFSQFVEPLTSPSIDSVSWRRTNEGVGIYVTTHDPTGMAHNFKWDYEEVWQISSSYPTFSYYADGVIKPRPAQESIDMFLCWKYDYPAGLIVESTAALTEDIVYMKPLIAIPVSDEKISERYSVLVKQRVMSQDEFNYLQLIQRNTEQVGGFADPLPGELYGNLYRLNSDEPVVGFIGASSTSEERIFIREWQVPEWNYDWYCETIFVSNQPDSISKYFGELGYVPTFVEELSKQWFAATPICVDCRLRGGQSGEPEFWD